MGQIAIVSFQNSNPKVIECFNVESRILCMVYIPEEEKPKDSDGPAEAENAATKPSCVPTVCLGMEEGRWVAPGIPGESPYDLHLGKRVIY